VADNVEPPSAMARIAPTAYAGTLNRLSPSTRAYELAFVARRPIVTMRIVEHVNAGEQVRWQHAGRGMNRRMPGRVVVVSGDAGFR
jgi:hypothetical protein